MKKLRLILLLVTGSFLAVSCSDDDNDNGNTVVPEADRMFVTNAAVGGMFEVKAGEMAVAKGDTMRTGMVMGSDSMSIKSFGQMMITDHTKANNELKSLADNKDVDVPTALSAPKQLMLDSLTAVSGTAFNMLYAKMMVASHKETVALFEKQAATGQDAELKSWASQTLPVLKHHLEMAEMMHEEVK